MSICSLKSLPIKQGSTCPKCLRPQFFQGCAGERGVSDTGQCRRGQVKLDDGRRSNWGDGDRCQRQRRRSQYQITGSYTNSVHMQVAHRSFHAHRIGNSLKLLYIVQSFYFFTTVYLTLYTSRSLHTTTLFSKGSKNMNEGSHLDYYKQQMRLIIEFATTLASN